MGIDKLPFRFTGKELKEEMGNTIMERGIFILNTVDGRQVPLHR